MNIILKPFLFLCLTLSVQVSAQTVVNGIPWYDQNRYSPNGIRRSALQKGINIVNNRKIFK